MEHRRKLPVDKENQSGEEGMDIPEIDIPEVVSTKPFFLNITDAIEIDGCSIYPAKTNIKHVVFDWNDTLSNSNELGADVREFSYKQETTVLFKTLARLGINISIIGQNYHNKSDWDVIKNCLERNNIDPSVVKYHCAKTSLSFLGLLESYSDGPGDRNTICLVDDNQDNCERARMEGFSCVEVKDVERSRVKSSKHLHETLRLCLDPICVDAAKTAIHEYLKDRTKLKGNYSNLFRNTRLKDSFMDDTLGKRRAFIILYLLDNHVNDPLEKAMVMFSIISNKNGDRLKKYCCYKMGFLSEGDAEQYFRNEINNEINKNYHQQAEDVLRVINVINNVIMPYLVWHQNSDKMMNQEMAEILDELFTRLPRHFGNGRTDLLMFGNGNKTGSTLIVNKELSDENEEEKDNTEVESGDNSKRNTLNM